MYPILFLKYGCDKLTLKNLDLDLFLLDLEQVKLSQTLHHNTNIVSHVYRYKHINTVEPLVDIASMSMFYAHINQCLCMYG